MARGDVFTAEELMQKYGGTPAVETDTPVSAPVTEQVTEDASFGEQFKEDIVAPTLGAVSGFAQLGRPLQQLAGKGINFLAGREVVPDVSKEAAEEATRETLGIDTESTQFNIGRFLGETSPFLMTGGQAGAATQGMGLFSRTMAQAIPAGAVSSLQRGKVDDQTLMTAALAGATVPAGDLLKAAGNTLSKSLPDWLVRPLVKQSAQAKQQGKDIVPFMLEKGRIGSVDSLIQQSDDAMRTFDDQIQAALQASDETINFGKIAQNVADDINRAGGQTTADEILSAVKKQAFQARGSLSATDDVALATANSVRSQLDDTLYRGRDYYRQVLPENRAVLEAFTNTLRENVKSMAPKTRPLFDEYAKEITLKKALEKAASAGGGRLSVGLGDIVTGGGVFGATGDPVTAALAIGGRRAFETPQVKTALARVFTNTEPVITALEKASPAVRATFVKFMDDVLSNTDMQTQSQSTETQPQM